MFIIKVNFDDCWQIARDANGTILADPVAFPNGIKAIADYVHSRNLKFGLYSGFYSIFIDEKKKNESYL